MNETIYEEYLFDVEIDMKEDQIKHFLSNSDEWDKLFYKLTNEDREKYFMYIKNDWDKMKYLNKKSDDFIINYIKGNIQRKDEMYYLYRSIELIKEKSNILKIIGYLPLDFYEYYMFPSFFKNLATNSQRLEFIKDAVRLEIGHNSLTRLLDIFDDDSIKVTFFENLNLKDQVTLIQNFSDMELKKEYALLPKYSDYRSTLIASVDDDDFILEVFKENDSKKFRYNLLSKIKKEELRKRLLEYIDAKDLREFLMMIDSTYQTIDTKFDDVDSKITIGVELETCHTDIEDFFIAKNIFGDFSVKKDGSVNSGFEIVSPILHYNNEDMSKLYNVCELLKKCNFYTDYSCGGHIHIGSSYFTDIDEYKMLLYIYCNCENIIYLISNRINSKSRKKVQYYAKKIKTDFIKANNNGDFKKDYISLEEFKESIKKINGDRYHGLNLNNLNRTKDTFEFRMPNGEIDFNELVHNIKLFSKLVEKSKELTNIVELNEKKNLLKLLSQHIKEKEKLLILLDLLFEKEEDKKFYMERYNSNKTFVNSLLLFTRNNEALDIIYDSCKVLKKT